MEKRNEKRKEEEGTPWEEKERNGVRRKRGRGRGRGRRLGEEIERKGRRLTLLVALQSLQDQFHECSF
jgi:hypothetical protein